jgi:hypothetical protein
METLETVAAQLNILNVLLNDLYEDIRSADTEAEKDILSKVCQKIITMETPLYKEYHKLRAARRQEDLVLLVVALKRLDSSTEPDNYDKYIQNDEISSLASNSLIGAEGECLWENHEILKHAGFPVFPGERDRFGWLTGYIQTKKGILVFG